MDEVVDKPQKSVAKLLTAYEKQPALHKRILQLKALLYYVSTKGDFVNGLSRANLRNEEGKKLNSSNLNPILAQLQKKKLLAKDFNCNPLILHEIAIETVNSHDRDAVLSILGNFFDYESEYDFNSYYTNIRNIRLIHIAVHLNNQHLFQSLSLTQPGCYTVLMDDLREVFYQYSLDPSWVATRHPVIQLHLLCCKLSNFYSDFAESPPDLHQWLDFIKIIAKYRWN